MAFVRAKKQGGRAYHYLVTSERQGRRVRQKTLAYLGQYPSLAAALEGLPAEIAYYNTRAAECAKDADRARADCHPAWLERNGGEVPRKRWAPGTHPSRRYWAARDLSEFYERRGRKMTAWLRQLEAVGCSAKSLHSSSLS